MNDLASLSEALDTDVQQIAISDEGNNVLLKKKSSRLRQRLEAHKISIDGLNRVGAIDEADYHDLEGAADGIDELESSIGSRSTSTGGLLDGIPLPPSRPSSRPSSSYKPPPAPARRSSAARLQAGRHDSVTSTVNASLFLSIMGAASQERKDALVLAAAGGDEAAVRSLLSAGDDEEGKLHPDQCVTADNMTALHHASAAGHSGVVKALIEAGASVGCMSRSGDTPLHYSAYGGHKDVTMVLLEAHADVNAANEYGETALFSAARKGHLDVVKLLLMAGADSTLESTLGDTAIAEADEATAAFIRETLASIT